MAEPIPTPSAQAGAAAEPVRRRGLAGLASLRIWLGGLVALVVLGTAGGWWVTQRHGGAAPLRLHGNVDLRQVELPFNNSERIAEVLVQEGDRVRRGQVLARLETSRLRPQLAQAEAQVAAQQAVVERLHNGSRKQEIAQARANVALAAADALNAEHLYRRLQDLDASSAGRGVSRQDLDNAKAALDVARARRAVSDKALELELAGPRREEVAEAQAQLSAGQARLALLRQQLADAELAAPADSVVRSRLLEPGEMASPQRAVFTLAITDPKWVRAYAAETELGQVRPGLPAGVTVDAFPGRRFDGWVGFVSPVSEFTPKSVQTEELRTSLVYEVRVFVKDPRDELPLGTPATVQLTPAAPAAAGSQP